MKDTKSQQFHIENENYHFYFKTCYVASDGKRFYSKTDFVKYELPLYWNVGFWKQYHFKNLKVLKDLKRTKSVIKNIEYFVRSFVSIFFANNAQRL